VAILEKVKHFAVSAVFTRSADNVAVNSASVIDSLN